jgi:hypothetical protein
MGALAPRGISRMSHPELGTEALDAATSSFSNGTIPSWLRGSRATHAQNPAGDFVREG